MAKNGTQNGQKRVEVEQSSYYREYPVAFGQKRELVGVGQSDTANKTLCRYCFQGTSVVGQKAPGAPVFGHCPFIFYAVSNERAASYRVLCPGSLRKVTTYCYYWRMSDLRLF